MGDWIAGKIGDMVEDKVKSMLGIEDKDEDKGFFSKFCSRDDDDDDDKKKKRRDKDDEEGGFFSKIFDRDNDEDKWKEKKRDEDDGDESFFSRVFDRDNDDDKWKEKKCGFAGLFVEQGGAGAAGGPEGETVGGGGGGGGGGGDGGVKGQSVALNEGDLLNDLMNVAEETSQDRDKKQGHREGTEVRK
ncbi:aspartate and glycine-rich protein-like [Plectropomus leopardus]|uniref:aspartate and glycine-rich protein-like n=1 Tax=Plectropomus leopardus TaxID=160734 RepID=UPI001C4AA9C2|nr:aspartate and glycine-rich protein-like [Plectropomus leopardus]